MESNDAPPELRPIESPSRLMARLLGGGVVAGRARLSEALRVLDQARCQPPLALARPPTLRHVVIGALVDTPPRLQAMARRARPLSRAAGRWADRTWRLMLRVPIAGRVTRRHLAASQQRIAHWGELGRQEEAAARSLAEAAAQAMVEVAVAVVADSPDVRRVIEEQSAGLTRSMLEDIRDRSARADERAQALARHLLRRRRRPPASQP
jgi:hypothetical protein